ncbi:MAG: 2-oxoacid:acceptor oxidoreductase family protein [Candidatus Marinimicrobia bacterium]|nr:2-oxoacid:acceptor oxidoreductase family protein [Candidatus Neomarinimicrobiota bacterium]
MTQTILQKAGSFYKEYERKEGGDKQSTHYCPGCGHGILHKMIAEAIDDFKVRDKSIFVSPVGCSVFAYYYFDMGNLQAAHGRAPAVGTGYKRANPNSIVISYQGDGDLAAIGTNEIIHAANRGEGMTVFFVNNAIYGMTGGQMAPTTLIGQKTTTTPNGRTTQNEGFPIKMSEIIATLEAPVYVERTMLTDAKNINKTRRAVRKALQYQIENKGFSFVEVLSGCPTGWKASAPDSRKWIEDVLSQYFPIGVFKDVGAERASVDYSKVKPDFKDYHDILDIADASLSDKKGAVTVPETKDISEEVKIAGFGGQGVLSLGYVLANIGMGNNYHVSWIPSYGPEMRGGTANCSIKISKKRIGAPVVSNPKTLIAMNKPSMLKFEPDVTGDGNIIYDSSLIDEAPERQDVNSYAIPATKLADKIGSTKAANMVLLGAYSVLSGYLSEEYIRWAIPNIIKNKRFMEINDAAFQKGAVYMQELLKQK